jgi:hypothetical protein
MIEEPNLMNDIAWFSYNVLKYGGAVLVILSLISIANSLEKIANRDK